MGIEGIENIAGHQDDVSETERPDGVEERLRQDEERLRAHEERRQRLAGETPTPNSGEEHRED